MKTRIKTIRILVATAVLALAVVAAHLGGNAAIGTLCALCPVGFAQIAVASGSVPWGLMPGVLAVLVIVFLLGRAFCSWLCPSQLLKNVFGGHTPRGILGRSGEAVPVFRGGSAASDPSEPPASVGKSSGSGHLPARLLLRAHGQAAREDRLRRPPSGRLRHLHLEGGLPNLFHRVPRGHRRGGSRQGDAGGLHLLPRLRGELPHEVHQGQGGGREADTRLFRRAFRR